MEVKSSPEPRQSVDESKPLQQAKTLLDTILGPQSSSLVTREWKPVPDHQGRTHYRIRSKTGGGIVGSLPLSPGRGSFAATPPKFGGS